MGKRIKAIPKHNESFRFNVGVQRKKKDNPTKAKISSNRMTILPGFLSYGVKSDVAKKEEGDENRNHENILKEDLHSLFLNKKSPQSSLVRRSLRISQRNSKSYCELSEKKIRSQSQRTRKSKTTNRNSSKKSQASLHESLSEDIPNISSSSNKRYSQNSSKSLFKRIISSQSFNNIFTNLHNSNSYNENLLSRIHVHFKETTIDDVRRRIHNEMNRINDILTGKLNPVSSMGNLSLLAHDNSDNEQQVPEFKSFMFPPDEWQYNTPPSQKLNMTLYEESAIQPAIFCNDGNARNIYELKKDVDTNLINCVNPANIEVDNRFMEQIARFDKENRPLKNFPFPDQNKKEDKGEFNFNPTFVNQYFNEHLASIHARPRKTVKRLRFADTYSRNELILRDRQLFKQPTSNLTDTEPMDSDFDLTIMNCLTDDSSLESPQNPFKMVRKVNILKCFEDNRNIFPSLNINNDD